MIPICLALFDLCPSRYAMKSMNNGSRPELKANTSRGVQKFCKAIENRLDCPSSLVRASISGVSWSTRVMGVRKITQTMKSMIIRNHERTLEKNSSLCMFSQIMSELAGAFFSFH